MSLTEWPGLSTIHDQDLRTEQLQCCCLLAYFVSRSRVDDQTDASIPHSWAGRIHRKLYLVNFEENFSASEFMRYMTICVRFYAAMLHVRGIVTASLSVHLSVCLSVRDEVSWSHRLEFFENNFKLVSLEYSLSVDPSHWSNSTAKGTPRIFDLNRGGVGPMEKWLLAYKN